MTRSPRGDSACRFIPDTSSNLHRPVHLALAIGLGLAISCTASLAQTPAKGSPDHIKAVTAAVDGASIKANTATSNDWPTIGLDYAETRFSKLNQINTDNVKKLGLVWSYPLESSRGVEATPVVVDGIMYQTASWSVVHAIDARTGKRIWTFDPKIDREKGYRGCCDVVNRGVALWKGKVYFGAYDGRLFALDAATGKVVWEKDTIVSKEHSYTITGAPRVFNGKVVIGNGGAEFGVRGYVTAYDAETGNQAWRWFTVPGDPSKPFEDESMAAAAKTWDPAGKYWINGGGGTAWDTITFDPDLNLVYIGTGNGAPWNQKVRSPAGGDKDLALPECDAAIDHVAAALVALLAVDLGIEGPEPLAGAGVDGVHHAPRCGLVHDAVDHDRRRLDAAGGFERIAPHQPEFLDIVDIDLVELGKARLGIVETDGRPVVRSRGIGLD